jgi:hypothetical protein
LCASASASVGAASGPPLDPLALLASPAPESLVADAPDDVPDPELEVDASVEPDGDAGAACTTVAHTAADASHGSATTQSK